jgi:hypothetical protein
MSKRSSSIARFLEKETDMSYLKLDFLFVTPSLQLEGKSHYAKQAELFSHTQYRQWHNVLFFFF